MKQLSENIKAWIDHVPDVEASAMQQLRNVASMPFVRPHLAVMPDVHWGMGATVGSVIPTFGAIIPAAVGVDIGCGMIAARLNVLAHHLPDNLAGMRSAIEEAVPHGRTNNGGRGDKGAWDKVPSLVGSTYRSLAGGFNHIVERNAKCAFPNPMSQLGTLGGGNHFVELCTDEHDRVWIMLHSGSRGVGNRIGSVYIAAAKEEAKRNNVHLPDQDLAFIAEGSELFVDYTTALQWAQNYARLNRELMLTYTLEAVRKFIPHTMAVNQVVSCHHNYVNRERHYGSDVWVTRKGAVSAKAGELGIIPGAMGRKSFIVRGKGNPEALCSCSHGAGRAMSRGEAKRRFTVEDHVRETEGLECRKDADVVDETPQAYKDIDNVMASQADLVDIEHTLRAVLCVKG